MAKNKGNQGDSQDTGTKSSWIRNFFGGADNVVIIEVVTDTINKLPDDVLEALSHVKADYWLPILSQALKSIVPDNPWKDEATDAISAADSVLRQRIKDLRAKGQTTTADAHHDSTAAATTANAQTYSDLIKAMFNERFKKKLPLIIKNLEAMFNEPSFNMDERNKRLRNELAKLSPVEFLNLMVAGDEERKRFIAVTVGEVKAVTPPKTTQQVMRDLRKTVGVVSNGLGLTAQKAAIDSHILHRQYTIQQNNRNFLVKFLKFW